MTVFVVSFGGIFFDLSCDQENSVVLTALLQPSQMAFATVLSGVCFWCILTPIFSYLPSARHQWPYSAHRTVVYCSFIYCTTNKHNHTTQQATLRSFLFCRVRSYQCLPDAPNTICYYYVPEIFQEHSSLLEVPLLPCPFPTNERYQRATNWETKGQLQTRWDRLSENEWYARH